MNLQYLKAFYVTVKANSISKAAKILHLTQPGLSMQIQSLEKELGVSLLNRSNKGVELTEAGRVVFDYATTILSLQDNIERDLENLKTDKKHLLLGSCKAIGEYALPCSIYVYKQNNKDIDINLEISNTEQVVENLISKTVNIGILHGKVDNPEIIIQKITTDRLLLVTSLPLVKNKVNLNELTRLPLIFREKGSGTRKTILNSLKKHNIKYDDLNIIYELNSMEAIKTSVISGKGISFIPELTIKRELKDGILKAIEIENLEILSEFYISYTKDHALTPYEKDFIKFINSSKRGFC
ncbi:DNA-binding transcriptional regulator, LysR family [Caminicella sporogenes DSM 14501]|uniref:DNA-binding transcriptional regulator, LysR family n=1 Tax=Caminicella sporogenes DSM 14501 TaxID=1121266 RepID=A0A1M6T0Q7_9FIRM|nr:LysR family transcriptional regulator [Caminicella sporogenes]RKD26376.1 LysR family transcriptional regulator [Caminicella sporogenes]SHK50497.1 DNA-binding transcriptional regulator, LysR family [Caminicella sporogenes DSM 14501]